MSNVSVIIPTVGRASLRDAVWSVAAQRNCRAEAVVVLDAPAQETAVRAMLRGLPHRLAISNGDGAAVARNIGLDLASGAYLGYLDDDDTWLPEKAARQIAAIEASADPGRTFSTALSEFRRSDGTVNHRPPRPFDPAHERIGDALVSRTRLRHGTVLFNTPSLLGPAALMRSVRWDESLRKHQDWDLIIRLWSLPDVHCAIVEQALVRVQQGSTGSISALHDWRDGAVWLRTHDADITGRARADFVSLHILQHALRARSWNGIRTAFSLMHAAPPHAAAAIRGAAGLLLRR